MGLEVRGQTFRMVFIGPATAVLTACALGVYRQSFRHTSRWLVRDVVTGEIRLPDRRTNSEEIEWPASACLGSSRRRCFPASPTCRCRPVVPNIFHRQFFHLCRICVAYFERSQIIIHYYILNATHLKNSPNKTTIRSVLLEVSNSKIGEGCLPQISSFTKAKTNQLRHRFRGEELLHGV